ITVNTNGTLNILDKKLNVTFENVLMLENGADDGDEYDFSPLADDFIITSESVKANVELKQNTYRSSINISYTMEVPKDLDSRKAKVVDTLLGISINIELDHNKPFIKVSMDITNTANDHRLRAYVPTGISSEFSISDNQFGSIKRGVVDEAMAVWEAEGWDERPDAIYPMLTYTTLCDDTHGMAVLTNSSREFEIVGDQFDTIALTLFRSVGFLGKEEMLRRPGRPSGIKLPTPDSQMIGKINLEFAISTYAGDALAANVAKLAKEYLTPIVTYNKMPHNAMKLNAVDFTTPYTYSLLKETNEEIVLSTVKKSEKADGIIVRFFNASQDVKHANFEMNAKTMSIANLNEELQGHLMTLEQIECGANTVKSLYVELD
ncbi:MAG: glycoside hydrolase family 38 C-terminal domain-containing protein, partial [Turicibacter sp.]